MGVFFGRMTPPDPIHWRRHRDRTRRFVRESGYFDESWYLVQNPDVARAGVDPLDHYLDHGGTERRNPSLKFDTKAYLAHRPEAAAPAVQPLLHYLSRDPYQQDAYPIAERRAPIAGSPPRRPVEVSQSARRASNEALYDLAPINQALAPLGYRLTHQPSWLARPNPEGQAVFLAPLHRGQPPWFSSPSSDWSSIHELPGRYRNFDD